MRNPNKAPIIIALSVAAAIGAAGLGGACAAKPEVSCGQMALPDPDVPVKKLPDGARVVKNTGPEACLYGKGPYIIAVIGNGRQAVFECINGDLIKTYVPSQGVTGYVSAGPGIIAAVNTGLGDYHNPLYGLPHCSTPSTASAQPSSPSAAAPAAELAFTGAL